MPFLKVVALILCLSWLFSATEERCKDENVCVQTKTHGMWSADCYNGNFKNFPRCLRSDVEIIDLSYNRLRKITKEDLSRYTSLKYLYLSDNLLTKLDNSTFQDMDKLMSLDLSLNGFSKVPPIVFHLPSLKRLYLSQNQNINIVESIEEASPITSPLEAIDIAFNDLETLPNLGIMPYLTFYNISGNNLANMEVNDIAGLCNLKTLANNNFTTMFNDPCECWNMQRWLKQRDVKFAKIPCEVRAQECPYKISEEDMLLYQECKSLYSELELKSTFTKIGIAVAVLVVIVLLLLVYFIYRRRRKQRKSKQKLIQMKIPDAANGKPENDGLL